MLTVNNRNLCEYCFAEIPKKTKKCPYCSGQRNKDKYPTALTEGVILMGRYAVGRVLGKGGFGITYLCYDLREDKKVAVKEYLPDSLTHRHSNNTAVSTYDDERGEYFRTGARKFFDEAKLVSRFNGNPNIISVYEFFFENNTTYFVMEYLDGVDFKNYIAQNGKKISENEAVYIMDRLTDALMIVHSTDILHRDISPDNIFICRNGDIKLIDFGAARQVVGEASKSLSVILKQGFAPFEQYQRRGKQGPWTDIYALGATMYYALTGIVPEDAMSRMDDASLDPCGISPEFMKTLEKMLAVRANERYQSVFELKKDLSKLRINKKAPFVKPEAKKKSFCCKCGRETESGVLLCFQCSNTGKKKLPVKKPVIIICICVLAAALITGLAIRQYSRNNRDIISEEVSDLELYSVYKDSKSGYIDQSGKVVIPLIYDSVGKFSEGLASVKKDGKWGYIDKSGNVVIPIIYDDAYSFSEGLAMVRKDGKYGYIDKSGNVVIPFIYDNADSFYESRATVAKGFKCGYIDKSGNAVTQLIYDAAYDFSEGLAYVSKDGKWGYIDKSGNAVTQLIYDAAYDFSEGLAAVEKDDKWGYIDKSGNVAIPFIYDVSWDFDGGLAKVRKDDKSGVIDKSGNIVIPLIYDSIGYFHEELALAEKDGKWGYIDKSGNVIIPFIYDDGRAFSEGIAKVHKDGKWGYIDKSGKAITPFIYDNVGPGQTDGEGSFSEGRALVLEGGKYGYIDTFGKVVIPLIYDDAHDFSGGYAIVTKDDKVGYINKAGIVIWRNDLPQSE